MSGQGTVQALCSAMWVLSVVAVPMELVWLVRVGYLTGQRLPEGDVVRWAPPTCANDRSQQHGRRSSRMGTDP